jgi:hypothetical protein
MACPLLLALTESMNEIKTGLLMLLFCAALYTLANPGTWTGLLQAVSHLVRG